jgi:CRP/FNR family transcriptional regulator, cyclic AMP receptor protein
MLARSIRHHRRVDGKIEALRRLPPLAGLSHSELVRLAALAELVEVPAATALTCEGDVAREAYLVVSGRLRVSLGELTVTWLGAGDFAGDVALLDRQPRATGITAVTHAQVAVLTRPALQQLARTSPWFADRLLGQLATRVRSGVPT